MKNMGVLYTLTKEAAAKVGQEIIEAEGKIAEAELDELAKKYN